MAGRHWEAGLRVSSADWFKAGVARQRVGPISLGSRLVRVEEGQEEQKFIGSLTHARRRVFLSFERDVVRLECFHHARKG